MPTKPRPEDVFIEAFLSAYEDLSWADCDKDWVDRRKDRGVEMLATRKSDGQRLAIEHTIAQPFVGEIADYKVYFEPSFLKLEADTSLAVPGRFIQVFVPSRTLENYKKKETIAGIVRAVHSWIKDNRLTVEDGQHDYACPIIGVPGAADFEITLTVKARASTHGQLNVRRQQKKDDFDEVVRTIMEKKVSKLAVQDADKRVLILERQHINHVPERIMAEMRKQTPNYTDMAKVDEVWILETIGYQEPGWHFMFELNDENDRHLATLTFERTKWTGRSGPDGIPICNYD